MGILDPTYDEYLALNDYFEDHYKKQKEYYKEQEYIAKITEENNLNKSYEKENI